MDNAQAQVNLIALLDVLKHSGDLLSDALDVDSVIGTLIEVQKLVNKLADGSHILVNNNTSFLWNEVDAQQEWLRYFMHEHNLQDEVEAVKHPEFKELSEDKIENVFLYLNDNDHLNSEARNTIQRAFENGLTTYAVGDEVYWNDPDNGLCSGYATVKSIKIGDDPIYIIETSEGSITEVYESELS